RAFFPRFAVAVPTVDWRARTDPKPGSAGQLARVYLHPWVQPGLWARNVPASADLRHNLADGAVSLQIPDHLDDCEQHSFPALFVLRWGVPVRDAVRSGSGSCPTTAMEDSCGTGGDRCSSWPVHVDLHPSHSAKLAL